MDNVYHMAANSSDPALLAAALDSIPFGVLIASTEGKIIWVNRRLTLLTGFAVGELLGQSVGLLEPESTPYPFSETLRKTGSAAPPCEEDSICRHRTGKLFSVSRTVAEFQDGNLLVTFQESHLPVSQNEERSRLIAKYSVDVIWLWSLPEERCVFVTPSVETLRGYSTAEILDQSMEQALTPESYRSAIPMLQACVAAVQAGDESCRVRSYELDFTCKNAPPVPTETVARLISGESGKVQYILGVTRDIRVRRLAQQAFREAEEKYHQLFDGALEGIYRTSIAGRPLAANPAMAKMLGFDSPEEALSSITDVASQLWVDSDERRRFIKLLQEQGTVRGFECRQRRKDGTVIWVSISSRRVYGPAGEALFHEGFMEDVTERKRMEDALRQSEEKFAKVFRSSPACISIHDIQDANRILDVNEAFEKITGYGREEAIGRTVDELNLWTDPSPSLDTRTRLLSDGKARNVEHRFRTRLGEMRTGLLSVELIEIDGQRCAIATNIDITERKQAEDRIGSLATAIEQAGEQIVITGLNGTIEYCNPAFEKASGYSKQEVLGRNPRMLKSGRQSPDFYRSLWKTISSGLVWTGRFTNRKKDGSLFEEEATISPIHDGAGKINGYVAIKRDVSERIQLENQFRQAQKLESVGRLAGGVAHDFNNLLTVINGYSGLLLEELKTYDPLWPYVDEIGKAGERAAGLTKQLLAFSRKQVIETKVLDINSIIRDTERMLRRLIGEDIELLTILDPALGNVMGDPDQIHQVIMNLVVNARDAMPNGGTLIIETSEADLTEGDTSSHAEAPGRYIVMSLTDNGIGMDENTMESIFEPFFTTKEQGKGTGLGLSTVYGIVRQNGGWVDVSSRIGEGATFRIYLPRIKGDPAASVVVSPETTRQQCSETVLLVEDQDEVRHLVKAILEKNGYQVLEARNGAEAYLLAQEHNGEIHLLLTDVVMPGINGKELSERLLAVRPKVKVLFSSGYTADVIARRGVLEPNVAYLSKPFNPDSLTSKVREVLRG